MNFLKIEDEIKFSHKMFILKREIEDFLFSQGYSNTEPTVFEDYDEFIQVNDRINKQNMVKFLDSKRNTIILTPDITTGIVNKLLPRWDAELKLKLFYYGKTYTHSETGIKENRQMGVEYLGEKTENTDEKILETAIHIIQKYSSTYLFEIGSSKFLRGIMQGCSFNKQDYDNVMNLINKKNKQDLKDYLSCLPYREAMGTLLNIFDLEGSFEEIKAQLSGLYLNDTMKKGIEEIENTDRYFKNVTNSITYDLSTVSELSYYDGMIFRGYIDGSNKEIIKGGRYDLFTQQYGYKVPAIGFSVELDELIKSIYREETVR